MKMKEYIKLTVDAEAYYSGNTYYEEVFLPLDVWEEIKDGFRMFVYLCEFDGKHSEVKAKIEVDDWTEEQLTRYLTQSNDGENLFDHVYEYLDEDKYDNSYLMKIQEEVEAYCQVDTMEIEFNKKDKEKILELLKEYII
jgi:hypothetical protein